MSKNQPNTRQESMVKRWLSLSHPIRPSKGMLSLYEKNIATAMEGKPDPAWGLLGCTPEIRSIAGKYQAEIFCIDINPDAFYGFKEICAPSKYERFICADWLNINIDKSLDIVIGDGSMSMIPKEEHAKFLKNIHSIVKPKGYVLLRFNMINTLSFDNEEKIFEWYRRENRDKSIYYSTKPYLYALWLNDESLKLSNSEFQEKIKSLHKDGIIYDEEFEEMIECMEKFKKFEVFVQYTKKEIFEKLIFDLFKIISVDYAGDYPLHTNHPIYFLQKK